MEAMAPGVVDDVLVAVMVVSLCFSDGFLDLASQFVDAAVMSAGEMTAMTMCD